MIVVTISYCELETAVLHLSSIHGNTGVGHTGISRNRNIVKQVGRSVLEPLGSELNTVVQQCQVNTNVHGFLLLPCDVLVNESRDSRTCYRVITKRVGHVVTGHCCLVSVLTDVLITEFTIATTNLEHVYYIAVEGEEVFLIETPTQRY